MITTGRLTTDYTIMYIDIPTDKGIEHYSVEIDRPDMDEDVYCIGIHELVGDRRNVYSRFEVNKFYGVVNGYELDEREYLILSFITNRLELD